MVIYRSLLWWRSEAHQKIVPEDYTFGHVPGHVSHVLITHGWIIELPRLHPHDHVPFVAYPNGAWHQRRKWEVVRPSGKT